MRLPVGPIRRAWWGVRARVAPRARILVYHRIGVRTRDPWLLSLPRDVFAQHLALLKTRYDVVRLSELVDALAGGRNVRNAVVITFDDGYADNCEVALPMLEDAGLPATFFITAGYVDSGRELWWDALERVSHAPGGLTRTFELPIPGAASFRWNAPRTDATVSGQLLDALYARAMGLVPNVRDLMIAELHFASGIPVNPRPDHALMTSAQVRELAAHPLVDVGAHSMTHTVMSLLSMDEQRREIRESRARIEELVGKPVTSFAYPFGHDGTIDDASRVAAREAGMRVACSTEWAPATRRADLFALPRLMVRNGDAAWLERTLRAVG
jgi:peptidoglycan/xylan/chitin deacetylase (PgdA/CDA1 family)